MKEKNESHAPVIALNYHDGALDGFVKNLLYNKDAYFTAIAWDSNQDIRLFALVDIPSDLFGTIMSMIELKEGTGMSSTLLFPWNRLDGAQTDTLEDKIKFLRARIGEDGYLLVASHVTDPTTRLVKIGGSVSKMVETALARKSPGDLSSWEDFLDDLP